MSPRRQPPSRRSDELTPQREQELLAAHRAGDAEATSDLLRGYQHRIYSICYRMLRDPDTAQDLAQDSMVRILEGLDSYDGRAKLSTWVIRLTMNCVLSHLRREKLRQHASLDRIAEGHTESAASALSDLMAQKRELSGEERVEQEERRAMLEKAMAVLDPSTRMLLVLRDVQGLDYQQLADVLEVPVGTVKSRLFRARLALREAIEAMEGQDDEAGRNDSKQTR